MRAKLLGLRSRKRSGFSKNSRGEPIPALHAYSPIISPRPGDWPDSTVVTGFWRLDDIADWAPDAEFQKFLDAGEAADLPRLRLDALGRAAQHRDHHQGAPPWGGRAVVGKGWGGIRAEDLPDTVYSIEKAPHTKLFPLMRAVVHHGGAGTTYAGLYAGRPTFVVPHFFDQPYWGRRVYELGCGPAPVRLRKLTPSILAAALEEMATETSYQLAATELRERLVLRGRHRPRRRHRRGDHRRLSGQPLCQRETVWSRLVTAYDPGNIFGKIIRGEIPAHKVYEDADALVMMDIFPQSKGHVLVIPKAASRNLLDADPATLARVIPLVQRVAQATQKALNPDGIRLVQFNEAPAGQSVFHLHFHVIPVYDGVPLGRHAEGGKADDAELAAQAKAIAEALA